MLTEIHGIEESGVDAEGFQSTQNLLHRHPRATYVRNYGTSTSRSASA